MTIHITNANEPAAPDEASRRGVSRRSTSTEVAIERRQNDERRYRPGFSGLVVDLFGPQRQSSGALADRPNAR